MWAIGQHYNNILVFMLVWHVFMSSLLNQHPAQHHLSRVRPIPLKDLTLQPSQTPTTHDTNTRVKVAIFTILSIREHLAKANLSYY